MWKKHDAKAADMVQTFCYYLCKFILKAFFIKNCLPCIIVVKIVKKIYVMYKMKSYFEINRDRITCNYMIITNTQFLRLIRQLKYIKYEERLITAYAITE